MAEFFMNARFIVGAMGGLFFGFIVGKAMGAAGKAKEVRGRLGV